MRSHALLALAVSVVLSGCVIHEHSNVPPPGPVPQPGNVDMVWSFSDGQTCASLSAFVDHIRINVNGEQLANGGLFSCQTAGTQGVQLQNFAPASYTYSIIAENAGGFPLYQATGTFVVNGNVQVVASLNRVSNAQPGNVAVFWTLPNNLTCQSAGIDHMVINIPGEQLANGGVFPCQTAGVTGIQFNNFDPRTYTISIDAVDGSNTPRYHGDGSFTINGDTQVSVALHSTGSSMATLQLRWSFGQAGTSAAMTCAQAGVDHVTVTLGTFSLSVLCDVQGVDGADFNNLSAGQYNLQLDGTHNGQVVYSYAQSIAVSAPVTQMGVVLAPLYGSWDLTYNFSNAANCQVAGVSQVSLSVKDANGNELNGTAGQRSPCGDAPSSINPIHFAQFPGGAVTLQMYGYSSSGQVVRGATRATTLINGGANQTTVTLDTCGTSGSGC